MLAQVSVHLQIEAGKKCRLHVRDARSSCKLWLGQTAVIFIACIVKCLPAPASCLVIVLRGAQISVEAWMGQTAVIFIEESLGPFACFRVALRSVEVCLEGTSTAFIEASLKPFASF